MEVQSLTRCSALQVALAGFSVGAYHKTLRHLALSRCLWHDRAEKWPLKLKLKMYISPIIEKQKIFKVAGYCKKKSVISLTGELVS